MTKVAINGLGRIGRSTMKIILDTPELDLVAVNDLAPPDTLAYLLRYDTAYGRYERRVEHRDDALIIDGQELALLHESDPAQLPWGTMGVDVVFECTGLFTDPESMEKHLQAGAGRVVLSAPVKGEGVPTVVHGVNQAGSEDRLISMASCTTNCISPVMEILHRRIGVKKALMNTVHGYTSSQGIVDGPHKKVRRGRAAAANLVPTSTGAAKAAAKTLPDIEGRFDGVAVRAPVVVGSIADIVVLTERPVSVDEINGLFAEEAQGERYRDILGVAEDEFVSADIIKDPRASIVDTAMTQVVDGDLVRVMSWYDNEWGYSAQMVKEVVRLSKA